MIPEAIIRIEVQVTPQIHNGAMAHYWRIFRIDTQGNNHTLKDGFESRLSMALVTAQGEILRNQIQ